MDEGQFNSIIRLIFFLRSKYYYDYTSYGLDGPYDVFFKGHVQFPEDSMVIIEKLKNFKAGQFYQLDYIGPDPKRQEYFEHTLVQEKDEEIGFHFDTYIILFNYVTWCLKDEVKFFLETLENSEFIRQISGDIKQDDDDFIEFHKSQITLDRLRLKLSERIADPTMINHLFRDLWHAVMEYRDYICYLKLKIKTYLSDLRNYNFEEIELI